MESILPFCRGPPSERRITQYRELLPQQAEKTNKPQKEKEATKMNPTQEMIKRLFLSIAISVAAFIAGTSSVTAAPTMCDGFLPAGTYDTVIVPEGKTCTVAGGVT